MSGASLADYDPNIILEGMSVAQRTLGKSLAYYHRSLGSEAIPAAQRTPGASLADYYGSLRSEAIPVAQRTPGAPLDRIQKLDSINPVFEVISAAQRTLGAW